MCPAPPHLHGVDVPHKDAAVLRAACHRLLRECGDECAAAAVQLVGVALEHPEHLTLLSAYQPLRAVQGANQQVLPW
jgi:hypothetical protein